ncbi:MAG TPA: OB-fold domain-containing protein [Bryobacteraceae bacterium]|nr:OB-fold domain-containing protein [Bryobacteraceae bacterium]
MKGTIYTETIVYAAPAAFTAEAPYQLAIVTLDDGTRVTGRIEGERVSIDTRVELVEHRNGVPWFRREGSSSRAEHQAAAEQRVTPQETIA